MTDFIIVLRTESAVKTFSGNIHFSIGAGLSAAASIVGRIAEADIHAGVGGCAACYIYSSSKGKVFHLYVSLIFLPSLEDSAKPFV